ncbi:MAG: hypothetical protein M0Z76_04085 [Gammaproteobacteria bacterium]|nr:hypothetical protein [Gammaproteobacteria bacterium]
MDSVRQGGKALGQTVLGMMLVAGIGQAQAGNIHRIVDFNNNLSLSFVHSHVEYGERTAPSGAYLDTESGFINGGRVAFAAMGSDVLPNLYIEGSYQQVTGDTTYVGGVINTATGAVTPLTQNDNARMTDYAFRFGQGIALGRQSMLIPFFTYGTHHWLRGQLPTAVTPYDYQENYRNDYIGLGVKWEVMPVRHLLASVTGIYGRTVRPTIDAPAIGFAEGLGPKPWVQGGFALNYIFNRHESVFAGVTFTKFQYGQGPLLASGFEEPFSQTELTDYRVGVRFLI